MHCQVYDDEDEFEPRITPKPMAKPNDFAVPSVPEVSLIFDKPIVAWNKNAHDTNLSIVRSKNLATTVLDNHTVNIKSVSPNLDKCNSYAAWREQNFSRKKDCTSAMHVSSSYKNTSNYNHTPQSPAPQLCIPQIHVPQSYVLQSHASQSHVPQSHASQSHAPQSHVPQSYMPQSYASQSYASQLKLQDNPMQEQQKQDKICDRQSKLVNARNNDETHEKNIQFRRPDINDYNMEYEMQLSSSDKRPYNHLQRATCNMTNRSTRKPNSTVMNTSKQTEHLQIPHMAYPYPFQQFYAPNYQNRDVDNNETIKTLLQLISSQNEQIKTLQSQIDRLVRLQEESFRNRSACSCSLSHANQTFGYQSINCNETTNTLNSSQAQSHNSAVKKNVDQNASITENKDLLGKNKDDSRLEVALVEQQSKKAFMEQKVSIGVMTSFEFTVQNNPFLVDSEICEKREVHEESSSINRRSIGNTQDTTESTKRYKNTFTCKPGAVQLENIVEDTESYLSSSQQQSSNFNASSSVRDSEKHMSKQSDLHMSNTSESSKAYQHLVTNLNQEKTHEKAYIRNNSNFSQQEQNTREIWNASVDTAGNSTENVSYNKALIVNNADKEKSNNKTNANRHDTHSPAANYYHNYRNTECNPVKQVKDISDSMILSGGDFKVSERPPTPEPSIHVEMQEYTSDDESDKPKHTSKIGWTFYNNVLGQVNEILQNSGMVIDDKEENDAKITRKTEQENDVDARTALNTVKATTLEQLRKLGISIPYSENTEHKESNGNNKTLEFDSSFYPRFDYQANMTHTTSVVNETNTSMHMKALALKYLTDEQLADIALHKQGSSSLKHLMLSNVQGTNMSFATMRYLERYQLLPGRNNAQVENVDQVRNEVAHKHNFKPMAEKINPAVHRLPLAQTPGTTCPSRILDISALKRQPKLL